MKNKTAKLAFIVVALMIVALTFTRVHAQQTNKTTASPEAAAQTQLQQT